jgi:hypothetical protein
MEFISLNPKPLLVILIVPLCIFYWRLNMVVNYRQQSWYCLCWFLSSHRGRGASTCCRGGCRGAARRNKQQHQRQLLGNSSTLFTLLGIDAYLNTEGWFFGSSKHRNF